MHQTSATTLATSSVVPLKCIQCGAKLMEQESWLRCPECHQQWPVTGGIPRFYQPSEYYWGEISRQEAADFLAHARERGWNQAIETDIQAAHLRQYYLDLQRASWLALLGLDRTAVALDIGSGYGAITHSLALSLGKVYSIEAITERIEFTQERLRQEGVTNVSLFQASATSLPFFENSFDLIVANGILEWVGEWDREGSPRDGQLRFLSNLRRLLKDDGVLVIGIENRFGTQAFRGAIDHSGKPYTSLVPRRVATMILRRSKDPGHYAFWTRNAGKEYRTYTYSARGYRKLLHEAGFEGANLYWAQPGYNQPRRLVPLEAHALLAELYQHLQESYGSYGDVPWYRKAKTALARMRLSFLVVPDFVILASKKTQRVTGAPGWVRDLASRGPDEVQNRLSRREKLYSAAYTRAFSDKSVLRFSAPGTGIIHAVAQANLRKPSRAIDDVETEFAKLKIIHEKLLQHPGSQVRAPQPIRCMRDGDRFYALIASAQGTQFSKIARRLGYARNLKAIRGDFSRIIRANLDISEALSDVKGLPLVDKSWYQAPAEIATDPDDADRITKLRYFSEAGPDGRISWMQHGDFMVENVFLQEHPEGVEVIDWTDAAGGFPPLYDVLTLILQSGLTEAAHGRRRDPAYEQCLAVTFSDVFLEKGALSQVFQELLFEACELGRLKREWIPSLIVEFLLIRMHYNASRGEGSSSATFLRMLKAYMNHVG